MLVRPAKIEEMPSQYSDSRTSWTTGRLAVGRPAAVAALS
jgi:hypothetical protein